MYSKLNLSLGYFVYNVSKIVYIKHYTTEEEEKASRPRGWEGEGEEEAQLFQTKDFLNWAKLRCKNIKSASLPYFC